MKIAHILNPIIPRAESDLSIAKPITLASLKRAADEAGDGIEVLHLSAQYEEDLSAIPDWMIRTPDLVRSSLDHPEFEDKRKLPLMSDIWERLLAHSQNADVLVYSNIDIAVQPTFYQRVRQWVEDGHDAVSVTRRTIPQKYTSADQLEQMYAEKGEAHPGDDCFIVRRDCAQRFDVKPVFLGSAWFDKVLLLNCAARAHNFLKVRDQNVTFHIGDDRAWFNPKTLTVAMWNKREVTLLIDELEREFGSLFKDCRIWPYVCTIYEQMGFQTSILYRLSRRYHRIAQRLSRRITRKS